MNKKFTKGLLAGVCSTMVVMLIIMGIILNINSGKNNDDGDSQSDRESSSSSSFVSGLSGLLNNSSEVTDESHQNKKDYIKKIISAYYIDEVTDEDYRLAELRALLDSLGDPYSCYYTQEEFAELLESSNGIYSGIGAMVSQNSTTGIITIVKPFVDGPAFKAGLLPGDIIYKVEDKEVTGMDLSSVVSMMKGEEGTKVVIEIVREGVSEPIEATITRRKIEVPTVEYEMLDNNIGYIYVMEFDQVTEKQFINAVNDLVSKGMKGLVIDVRDNPGGLLSVVVNMLDRLLPEGMIVYTEDKNGKREEHKSTAKEKLDIPMAVLVNGYSASASEIFAGALQDYKMAEIVGTQSFGKGIVQSLFTLSDGSAIKITVSRYFTPNGRCIHDEGITPDIEVVLDKELNQAVEVEKKADNQLQAAIDAVMEKIKNGK